MLTHLYEWVRDRGAGKWVNEDYLEQWVGYHLQNGGVRYYAPFGVIEGVGFFRTDNHVSEFDWQESQGGAIALIDLLIADTEEAKLFICRQWWEENKHLEVWGCRRGHWREYSPALINRICYGNKSRSPSTEGLQERDWGHTKSPSGTSTRALCSGG